MIRAVVTTSLRNPWTIILLVAVLVVGGIVAWRTTPIDAIPDLSENQVLVHADWVGHGPIEVEERLTQPLVRELGGLAHVKSVRATSELGYSLVSVVFTDDADHYFARSRVQERLTAASARLPDGVVARLAPDATALGQIYWYTIEGEGRGSDELRALQDFTVRPALSAVQGVADVAAIGGLVQEVHVAVDPRRLAAVGLAIDDVTAALARSNVVIGGGVVATDGGEVLVRGTGLVRDLSAIEAIGLGARAGVPLTIGSVATVRDGAASRRAILEKNGAEAVGGLVVMRYGADPLTVTRAIEARLAELAPGLPAGVSIVPFHDRTRLIGAAIDTLERTLFEEIVVASLAVLLVLSHLRSALLVCAIVPLAVLLVFVVMRAFGIASNIVSLGGIAISIGVLVDAAIVMVENVHHRLREEFGSEPVAGDVTETILAALRTVAGPLVCGLAVMAASTAPILLFGGVAGRMFAPLAWTKLIAVLGVALLAVTVVPALVPFCVRGRLRAAEDNAIVRSLTAVYRPLLGHCLRSPDALLFVTGALLTVSIAFFPPSFPYHVLAVVLPVCAVIPIAWLAKRKLLVATGVLGVGLVVAARVPPLGEEFMPQLDEGTIVDMPVGTPGVSIPIVREVLLRRDRVLRSFPEVALVVGKAGRAESATDPSPLEMVESIVELRPRADWPARSIPRDVAIDRAEVVLTELVARGYVAAAKSPAERAAIIARVAGRASERFDDFARDFGARAGADATTDQSLVNHGAARFVEFLAEEHWVVATEDGRCDSAADAARWRVIANELAQDCADALELRRKSQSELRAELDRVVATPGFGNIWTQPIINRVDMLATDVRSKVGVKVFGDDGKGIESTLATIDAIAARVAAELRQVTGAIDAIPERPLAENYSEVVIDRSAIARAGLDVEDVALAIDAALDGVDAGVVVEGRRRRAVRLRSDGALDDGDVERIPVVLPATAERRSSVVPLAALATVTTREGPAMIRSENGELRGIVHLDVEGRDLGEFVAEARARVERAIDLPEGFRLEWSGRYEQQLAARERLGLIVPLVLAVIVLLLQVTYRDLGHTAILLLSVPGAIAGGVLFQALFDYPFSLAVWVGYVSCFGMAAGTGIVMLAYLREAVARRGGLAALASESELEQAVMEGAVKRLRPKLLTEGTMILGLLPLLLSSGTGSEILRPMAAPILGGILVADEVIDLLVPLLFHRLALRRLRAVRAASPAVATA